MNLIHFFRSAFLLSNFPFKEAFKSSKPSHKTLNKVWHTFLVFNLVLRYKVNLNSGKEFLVQRQWSIF